MINPGIGNESISFEMGVRSIANWMPITVGEEQNFGNDFARFCNQENKTFLAQLWQESGLGFRIHIRRKPSRISREMESMIGQTTRLNLRNRSPPSSRELMNCTPGVTSWRMSFYSSILL
jgi:hypothetical protein